MPKTTLAPIAKWTVEHERIVAMHIGGLTNEEIKLSTKKKVSLVRISQILSDPKAREIINLASLKIRSNMMESLDDGIAVLAITAMKRIAETINFSDFVLGSPAKQHQDRLGFDLIKLVKGDGGGGPENAPPLDAGLSKRLIEALEDANKADELIEEANFELVDNE